MAKEENVSKRCSEHTVAHSSSEHAQQHATMLASAQARPGIREVMQVYQNWQAGTARSTLITHPRKCRSER